MLTFADTYIRKPKCDEGDSSVKESRGLLNGDQNRGDDDDEDDDDR